MKKNKGCKKSLALWLILALIAVPCFAATIQSTIGGKNSSGNYHFTVDADGVLEAADGSTIVLGGISHDSWLTPAEIVTATIDTITSADNGKIFIYRGTAATDFTLPDCSTDEWEVKFVAATGQTITVDTGSTLDTIKYLTLDAGDALDSASATGDSVTLRCFADGLIVPMQMKGTWTDGGAN